jgi:hypothetical protein
MTILDYVYSLNVAFDWNKEDQRKATAEQREEYEDINRETLFYEPFSEGEDNELGTIYNKLLNDYIEGRPNKENLLATLKQDFDQAELDAYVEKYANAQKDGLPFYERFHGVDAFFIPLIPISILKYLINRQRVNYGTAYQVNVELNGCWFLWFEDLDLGGKHLAFPFYEVIDGNCIIPDTITKIGYQAFEYCTGLTNVTIPESVTCIDNAAFYGCTGLTSVVIPSSVTEIGRHAFGRCTGLKSVIIEAKMKKLERLIFSDCTSLESITLPAGIGKIDKDTFDGCTAIRIINVPAKKADYYKKRLPENLHAFIVEQ